MAIASRDVSLTPPARSLEIIDEMRARANHPEIQEIIDLLERDPVTTVHLLRQVNSPVYELRQRIAALDRAATMLGFDAVSNVLYVETHSEKPAAHSSRKGRLVNAYLVQTSVTASIIAAAIARELHMEHPSAVRTAALIHQLGRIAMFSTDPDRYLPLWKEATSPSGRDVAVPPGIGREIVHFRTDYTRHGHEIATEWRWPAGLTESTRFHADPERADEDIRHLVRVVAVAQLAARSMFEQEEHLDRDQAAERIDVAAGRLAQAHEMPRQRLDDLIETTRRAAYATALDIEL